MMGMMNKMDECLKHILQSGELLGLTHKTSDNIWKDILEAKDLGYVSFDICPYGDVWQLTNKIPDTSFLFWCFYKNCYNGYVNDLPSSLLPSFNKFKTNNYIVITPSLKGEVWSLKNKGKHHINMICKNPSIWNKIMNFIYIHILNIHFI